MVVVTENNFTNEIIDTKVVYTWQITNLGSDWCLKQPSTVFISQKLKKVTDLVRAEVMEIVKAKLKNIGVHYLTIDYANGHENPCQ